MDFSDQIELGARLASEQPDVGALERSRFKVVLLDEYQDTSVAQATMLSRLFAEGHAGHRGRRPQPGDLRLARCVGVQHPQLRRHLPGRWRARCRPTRSPSTGAPTRASSRSPTGWPPRSTRSTARSSRSSPSPRPTSARSRSGLRDARRRARPTWSSSVPGGRTRGSWAKIGVLTRDNAHAEDVFDALTGAGIPVEIVGLSGPAPAARGRRDRRDPPPAPRRHRQRLAADPAHRSALGDRAARPAAAQPAGQRDRRPSGPRRRRRRRSPSHLLEIADGIDPAEIPSLDDALADPGEAPYSAEALRAVRAARRRAADAAHVRRGAAARHRPPDHRHQRHRRRAGLRGQPGGHRAARQPRPVRQGGRGVPGRRRRRHPAGAAGLPDRRGRPGQRPRRRHPDRGRLGQAAHRPPRPRAWSGTRSSWSASARRRFPSNRSRHAVDVLARRCCRHRCAATPRDLPQLPG